MYELKQKRMEMISCTETIRDQALAFSLVKSKIKIKGSKPNILERYISAYSILKLINNLN